MCVFPYFIAYLVTYTVSNKLPQGTLNSPTTNGSRMSVNPSSLLAPRILSVSDGSWVHTPQVHVESASLTSVRSINRFYWYTVRSASPPVDRWTALLPSTITKATSPLPNGLCLIPISKLLSTSNQVGINCGSTSHPRKSPQEAHPYPRMPLCFM
jgi:hypothetical protein